MKKIAEDRFEEVGSINLCGIVANIAPKISKETSNKVEVKLQSGRTTVSGNHHECSKKDIYLKTKNDKFANMNLVLNCVNGLLDAGTPFITQTGTGNNTKTFRWTIKEQTSYEEVEINDLADIIGVGVKYLDHHEGKEEVITATLIDGRIVTGRFHDGRIGDINVYLDQLGFYDIRKIHLSPFINKLVNKGESFITQTGTQRYGTRAIKWAIRDNKED